MAKRTSTFWLTLAIALAFVVVAFFGVVTYRNTVAVRESERRVTHSYAVREATRELLSSFQDMETGQRGFIITGEPAYLEPYHAGRERAHAQFTRLSKLTEGNADQQLRLDRIHELFDQLNTVHASTIKRHRDNLATTGENKAREIVLAGGGKQIMDQILEVVGQILKEEERLLAEREALTSTQAATSKNFIIAGNVIALALLVVTGIVARLDRKKRDAAEAQMLSSQAELGAIFDSAGDGIITFNEDLRIRLMNPSAAKIHRCDGMAALGRSLLELVPSRLCEFVANEIRDFVQSDERTREFAGGIGLRGDGSEFPFDGSLAKATAAGGEQFITLMFRDLSESRAHETKIREQNEIINQVHDAIFVCDIDDRIFLWNRGAQSLHGYSPEEANGRSPAELLFGSRREVWDEGRQVMQSQGVYSTEVPLVDKDGHDIIVEHRRSLIAGEDGQPAAQLIIHLDITARKRDEAIERRSQRLESIGTLAGGIAHDLNNVLTPILMSAKLIKRGGNNRDRMADTIVASAERGGQMIKKLLAFAGGQQENRQRIDLREILLETEEILIHTLPKTIDLQVDCAANLHAVNGNSTELSQVLINLAVNARDAMPSGGRLTLRAENFIVDPARADRSDTLQAGPYVLLTIADTGAGIPKEIIERIFDPFFTTKEQGKGTGLGLATTLGIIRSCQGEITVYSEPGHGTSFSIYLPSTKLEDSSDSQSDSDEVPQGDGEMILLVDDEPLILETAFATLEAAGYRAQTVTSGADAIAVYQHQTTSIDLVLLDMMMPGMDGIATKDGLRAIDPQVRIIASSGLRRPGAEGSRLADFDGFLSKPYSDDQLLRIVRRVLNAKQTSNP